MSFILHRGVPMLVPLEEELDRELGELARPRPSRRANNTMVLDEDDIEVEDDDDIEGDFVEMLAPPRISEIRSRSPVFDRTPPVAPAPAPAPAPATESQAPMPPSAAASAARSRYAPTVQLRLPRPESSPLVAIFRAFTLGGMAALLVVVAGQAYPSALGSATQALSRTAHHAMDTARGVVR